MITDLDHKIARATVQNVPLETWPRGEKATAEVITAEIVRSLEGQFVSFKGEGMRTGHRSNSRFWIYIGTGKLQTQNLQTQKPFSILGILAALGEELRDRVTQILKTRMTPKEERRADLKIRALHKQHTRLTSSPRFAQGVFKRVHQALNANPYQSHWAFGRDGRSKRRAAFDKRVLSVFKTKSELREALRERSALPYDKAPFQLPLDSKSRDRLASRVSSIFKEYWVEARPT